MEQEDRKRIFFEVMQNRKPTVQDTKEQAEVRRKFEEELAALPPGAHLDWPSEIEA